MKQKTSLLSSMPHGRFLGVVNLHMVFCIINPWPFLVNLIDWVLFCCTGVVTARVLLRLVHESAWVYATYSIAILLLQASLAIFVISASLIVFLYFFSDLWEGGFCFQVGWGSRYCKPWCWQTQGFGWEVCSILHPKMIYLHIFPCLCYLVCRCDVVFLWMQVTVFICITTYNTFVTLACSSVLNKYCTVHYCL
jgi:hypothetical protein